MAVKYRNFWLSIFIAFLGAIYLMPVKITTSAEKSGKKTTQQERTYKTKNGEYRYLLFLPEGYGKEKKLWPTILFLHGAGERGNDLEKVKLHGPPKIVETQKDFPFIVISPQCPKDDWWTDRPEIWMGLLDDVCKKYDVDKNRIYLTGLSMGGFGTWALAMDQPNQFAALAPICGRGDPKKAALIAHVPTWVFHGAKDTTVPLAGSQEMVDALKAAGGDPKFTIYPDAGHDSWTATYDNPEFWSWLLAQRRGAAAQR